MPNKDMRLSLLLNTCVYVYNPICCSWDRYGPHVVDWTLSSDITDISVFIQHPPNPNHFDVVHAIV